MKNYVTPELHYFVLNTQDVLTGSSDLEFDITDWLDENTIVGGMEK
jgi:hypothetical protein